MKAVVALLIGIVIGGVGVSFFQLRPQPGEPELPAAMCDAVVKLSFDGRTIRTHPENVCLARGRAVTWEIDGEGEVEIDFETKNNTKGPFPHDKNNPHNKDERGKYKREKNDISNKISSNPAELIDRWKYRVKWTPPAGPPTEIDPVICIRK